MKMASCLPLPNNAPAGEPAGLSISTWSQNVCIDTLGANDAGVTVKSIAIYAMPFPAPPIRKIALIGYDGVQSLDLVGPLEVFSMANRFAVPGAYEVMLASLQGGEIVTNSGVKLAGSLPLSALPDDLDTVLVGGGSDDGIRTAYASGLPEWLQGRIGSARRIGSVCTGAFILAAAGLLDGRRATTHWDNCEALRAFRPAVQVEPDAIYVAEPPLYTSAGVTAGIDLCLSFVEADHGPEAALTVARYLVLFMHRAGGQSQYSVGLKMQAAATPRLRSLVAEICADPSGDLSLPRLAERAGMAERTFSRLFQKETATTPAAFVEAARMDRARALLESSDWPLERVAERAGFGSLDSLHRAFQRRVGVTPGDYRKRFGRARPMSPHDTVDMTR